MNKIKKLLSYLFIFVFLFQISVCLVNADSGWDSGYSSGSSGGWSSGSSGGWSSGSSGGWSSGSSSNYGSGYSSSSSDASLGDFVFAFIIAIVIVIILICYNNKTGGKGPGTTILPTNYDDEKIKESINDFNKEEFKDLAFTIYVEVQNAWMNIDYDTLRQLLTDELFNKYKSDLEVLELKKQKNVMSDYKLNNFAITNFNETDDSYVITCFMQIELHDYIVDKDNNVLRGDKNVIIEHDYELTFIRGKNNESGVCPNCHAKLDDKASKICPYCNSVIVTRNHDWVLSNKISKFQRTK